MASFFRGVLKTLLVGGEIEIVNHGADCNVNFKIRISPDLAT